MVIDDMFMFQIIWIDIFSKFTSENALKKAGIHYSKYGRAWSDNIPDNIWQQKPKCLSFIL